MTYSSKKILHVPARTVITKFFVVVVGLCIVVMTGRYIIAPLKIENYFQWVLCGTIVFATVCLPTAFFASLQMKHFGREKNDERYFYKNRSGTEK